MAGEKDKAMFFFTSDWMTDPHVLAMTLEQRGAYHWLLCLGWNEGGIPNDERALQGILGLTRKRFLAVWPRIAKHWTPSADGSRLVNSRQEKERGIRAHIQKVRAEAGRKGGKASRQEATSEATS